MNDEKPACFGCQIARAEIVPPGGDIWRDDYWHLAHDANNFIPGFLVLGTIPHLTRLYEIPELHYHFGLKLVRAARQILADQFSLVDCVLFQNDQTAGHFHLWILPFYPEMGQFSHPPEGMLSFLQWTKRHWNTPEKRGEIEKIAQSLHRELKMRFEPGMELGSFNQ